MHMLERARYFITHQFVRATLVLQIGNIAGTVVQAVSGMVIARILKPELFGQYSLAFSVASIVTIFLGAGVQDAVAPQIARAWAIDDQLSLFQALGFWAKFTLANIVATCLIVLALPAITTHLYHSGVMGQYAAIVMLASLVSTTVFTIAQLMLQITGRIRALSMITLADVVVRYGAVIGFALAGLGIWGAVSGHLVGALILCGVSILIYEWLARRYARLPGLRQLLRLAFMTPWRPLIGSTVWVMVDRNLGQLYGALPVAMVGLYASSSEVAYFKLAFGYLMLAMSTLGPVSTLLNVHFPTVQVTDRSRLRSTFIRVTAYSTLMTAGITLIVLGISPWVFRILYGQAYLPSIPYVYGFGIFGALFGLGVGLGPMWRAVNKVHISIVINLITLGVGVPLGIWMIVHWHLWGAVIMVTTWYTLSHMVSFIYLTRALKSQP